MESMVGVTTFGKVVGWRYIPFYSIENEREILRVIVIGSPFYSLMWERYFNVTEMT